MQRPLGRPGAPSADNATPIAERRGSGSVQSHLGVFRSHRRGDTPCHCRPVAAAGAGAQAQPLAPAQVRNPASSGAGLRSWCVDLLKEDFQSLWGYVSPYWAGQFLDRWCTRTMRSRLDPMKEVARMVALAPRPVSELVPSPGAVLQWRCRRLLCRIKSLNQAPAPKTHPQILLTPFFGHRRGDTPCHCRPVAAAPSTEKCSALRYQARPGPPPDRTRSRSPHGAVRPSPRSCTDSPTPRPPPGTVARARGHSRAASLRAQHGHHRRAVQPAAALAAVVNLRPVHPHDAPPRRAQYVPACARCRSAAAWPT